MRHMREGGLILWGCLVAYRSSGGAQLNIALQTFSEERGGYPPVRVVLIARVDRYLSCFDGVHWA